MCLEGGQNTPFVSWKVSCDTERSFSKKRHLAGLTVSAQLEKNDPRNVALWRRPRRSSTVLSCHLVVVCEVSRRPADLREQFLFGFRCCRGQPNKLEIRCLFCLKTMNIFRIDYLISLSKLTLRFWYHFSLGGISLSVALSLPVLFPSFSFPFKFSFAIFFPLLCTPNFFYKSMLWFSFFFWKT